MDDSDEDQRLPHHRDPKEFVSLDQLDGEHLVTFCRSNESKIFPLFKFLVQ